MIERKNSDKIINFLIKVIAVFAFFSVFFNIINFIQIYAFVEFFRDSFFKSWCYFLMGLLLSSIFAINFFYKNRYVLLVFIFLIPNLFHGLKDIWGLYTRRIVASTLSDNVVLFSGVFIMSFGLLALTLWLLQLIENQQRNRR